MGNVCYRAAKLHKQLLGYRVDQLQELSLRL